MRLTTVVLLGGWLCLGLLPSPAAAKRQEPTTYWRCYSMADVTPVLRPSVAAIEKKMGVVAPPAPITIPTWSVAPHTFDVDVRRGKKVVWIAVLVLVDTTGKPRHTYVIAASDKQVADKAGPLIAGARYHPALMNGKPVPCATYLWTMGAGIPN